MSGKNPTKRPQTVQVEGTTIVIPEHFQPGSLHDFLDACWQLEDARTGQVTFDFSRCRRSFPNQMLPTIAMADWFRQAEVRVSVIPPSDLRNRQIFESSNWLHYLAPSHHQRTDYLGDRHLAAVRFKNETEQAQLVREIIDRTISTVRLTGPEIDALRWSINEITGNVLGSV